MHKKRESSEKNGRNEKQAYMQENIGRRSSDNESISSGVLLSRSAPPQFGRGNEEAEPRQQQQQQHESITSTTVTATTATTETGVIEVGMGTTVVVSEADVPLAVSMLPRVYSGVRISHSSSPVPDDMRGHGKKAAEGTLQHKKHSNSNSNSRHSNVGIGEKKNSDGLKYPGDHYTLTSTSSPSSSSSMAV
ncbi:AAA family ATPase, partial [Reticulomyxa filosa]